MAAPAPREPPPRRPGARPIALVPRPDALVATETVAGRGPASVVETTPPQVPSILHGFRALRHRDFRLFYSGQLISLTGTWMQSLAQSWLVLTLTDSAFALGLVGALQFLPVLLLSSFGGIIADHWPKRRILLFTQAVEMTLALVMGILVVEGWVVYFDVLILAFLLGCNNAIDMPTRQAFVVELVGPEDLLNAIALNSTLFNSARLVGPALAGILIGIIGIAGAFFLNSVSFLGVIAGLLLMNPPTQPARRLGSFRKVLLDLSEGFRYVRGSTPTLGVILLIGALGTFGANFNVVSPLLAWDTLKIGATGLGWLMAAMGLGSLTSSLAVAFLSRRVRPVIMAVAAGAFSIFELALAPVTSFPLALVLLAMIGASMVLFTALANSYIQLTVPHRLRGRVMSIYTTVYAGTTPIGNTIIGALAVSSGTFGPLLLGGSVTLLATLIFGRLFWSAPHATAGPDPRG